MLDKFIYVHILKTAGTTIRYMIFEKFYRNRYLYDSTFKLKQNPEVKNAEHVLIIENQKYPDNYKKYNIFFGHFKHEKYEYLNLPMFSFIRHPVDRIVNQYYYHKGLYEKMGKYFSLMEFCEQWPNHMTDVLGDYKKYQFIGVVEKFKKSLDMFSDYLGVPRQKKIIKKRVSHDKKPITKQQRKLIEKINSVDMDLYHKILKKIKRG